MQLLKERILKDGVVKPGNVLKVDSFLNHQMDIDLINEIGKEFRRRFPSDKITKILTIEASGIGIACIVAQYFHVPVVFAKKAQSINIDGEVYHSKVESYTHKRVYDVILSKKFLSAEDNVLIIDDFLANGCALQGLIELVEESESYTHKRVYDVILSKKFLSAEDNVLIIDDFLANGCALQGLIELVEESGATIEGAGIVIEKGMQAGGQIIREKGIHLESLAIIDSMTDTSLTFKE